MFDKLTNRERDILILIAEGENSKSIAEKMNISIKTVNNHRSNICRKLSLPPQNNSLLNFVMTHKTEITTIKD